MDKLSKIVLVTIAAGGVLTIPGCKDQENKDYIWMYSQGQVRKEQVVHKVNLPSGYMDWDKDSKKPEQKYEK